MEKKTVICVIDDDKMYQFVVRKTLDLVEKPKKLMIFSDGEEALDYLSQNLSTAENLPDIIFLDINMPIMDGWDFLDEYIKLKGKPEKKITIYMVSSSVDPVDVERAKKMSEITGYVVKPIGPSKITEIIEAVQSV